MKENIGKWEAWTYDMDLVPHIYVAGTIPTNGQKPIVSLTDAVPPAKKESDLLLDLSPNVVDPNGQEKLNVEPYEKPLSGSNYENVFIRTDSIIAVIKVEHRER
jgi:hypothetical protein